jgi:alkylated DNA repair dioxygenase AlkB
MSTEYKKVSTLYQKSPPTVWTEPVLKVKSAIEAALGKRCTFDYVLINLYRDGEDSIGFHIDDEARGVNETYGPKNIVASLSLGETRTFVLRHSRKKKLQRRYALTPGSLIVMDGTTQEFWRHGVPKEPEVKGPRINLTFRVS